MCTACAEPVRVRQVGVSLVLSFMVVWDLPTIAAGVRSLQTSRLGPIYNEVAPSVAVFSQLFGKALQAQVLPSHLGTMCRAAGVLAAALLPCTACTVTKADFSLLMTPCGFIRECSATQARRGCREGP